MEYRFGANRLDFGTDLDPGLDTRSIFSIFQHDEYGGSRGVCVGSEFLIGLLPQMVHGQVFQFFRKSFFLLF